MSEHNPKSRQTRSQLLHHIQLALLGRYRSYLENLPDLSETTLTQMLKDLAAKKGVKLVAVAQPLRVALTGRTASPSLTDVISLLGVDESAKRLSQALNFIDQSSAISAN